MGGPSLDLSELTAVVPPADFDFQVKNREARQHTPATVMKPSTVPDVQQCVYWALKHGVGLTIVGGGHSGHSLWPGIVAIDMGAFDQVHILPNGDERTSRGPLIVAGAGCKSGSIISKAMEAGLTVPLGARPSVGAGLWLQGGIGHLSRLYGLACDAIVGAVLVSVASGQPLRIGCVPSQHCPPHAVCPENESELLWAIKGAGTNFGIVVSVTFAARALPVFTVRNWICPINHDSEAHGMLEKLDVLARELTRNYSTDAYLWCDKDKLQLGITMFESSTAKHVLDDPEPAPAKIRAILGNECTAKNADILGLFETDMYMSEMHGGHSSGKTSSFKRCVFLRGIGEPAMAAKLIAAIEARPSPLCYLHLLHGGGAVQDVADEDTAFGCRTWNFACVVTGVWTREQDGTHVAGATVQWVYNVVNSLLPASEGVYGADLGPDPRDAALAATAFGQNKLRLTRLKGEVDPRNVLAYACPLN